MGFIHICPVQKNIVAFLNPLNLFMSLAMTNDSIWPSPLFNDTQSRSPSDTWWPNDKTQTRHINNNIYIKTPLQFLDSNHCNEMCTILSRCQQNIQGRIHPNQIPKESFLSWKKIVCLYQLWMEIHHNLI